MQKLSSIKNIIPTNVSQFRSTTTEVGVQEYNNSRRLTDQERNLAVQNLMAQNPMEVDKRLRLQVQSSLSYQVDFNERFDNHQGKVIISNIDITCEDRNKLDDAMKSVMKCLIPLSDKELLERLTIMMAVQNKQNMNEDDLTLKIKSLVQLINYQDQIPADIIINAIDYLTRNSKWYPSYPEIYERCSHLMDSRKKLRDELHKRINSLAFNN